MRAGRHGRGRGRSQAVRLRMPPEARDGKELFDSVGRSPVPPCGAASGASHNHAWSIAGLNRKGAGAQLLLQRDSFSPAAAALWHGSGLLLWPRATETTGPLPDCPTYPGCWRAPTRGLAPATSRPRRRLNGVR
ncbi:hypothetical protein BS78_03G262400 [Paspalum vaginatum]|nr:hypothetical protein BS78_03G262400 [Paspalum vaginatum]